MTRLIYVLAIVICAVAPPLSARSQETSVNPGINDSFADPDVQAFVGRFEAESRELFARRHDIVAACRIKPGQTVADIGAGTGLFTRLFSETVGSNGRVIAVDISKKFLDHIKATSREAGQRNVVTRLATADSTKLPAASVDVAFICDTYHHFEFPQKTMATIRRALKPGGRVVLVDMRRISGTSADWVLSHVRAGQEAIEAEIVASGFKKVREEPDLLRENYFVVFESDPANEQVFVQGQPRGMGRGRAGFRRGRGPGPAVRADQAVFHYLLDHHADIRRTVTHTEKGVETLTESDQPEVAEKIQEHVAAMHKRVEEGRGLRHWDDLFVAIFQRHANIKLSVENTEHGVRVVETSEDPIAVALIQAHADVVSKFVARGFDEARQNHPVPPAAAKKTPPASDAKAK
jgi:predicted methyltransferase